jgi:hypothetical protein
MVGGIISDSVGRHHSGFGGRLAPESADPGDAWLLDRSDQLAARLARDGASEPVHIEETDTAFTIDWKGRSSGTRPTKLPIPLSLVGKFSNMFG